MEKIVIENAELYHGCMLEILPTLPKADLCIADPPYGIDSGKKYKNRGQAKSCLATTSKEYYEWDEKPASPEQIAAAIAAAKHCIVWGGNYFTLPPSNCWLVWDKVNGENDFADCELAWTNIPSAVRLFRHMWNGMLRDSEKNEPRCHATQKPVALMKWCIQRVKEAPKLVVDPYMGSSPVGIACADMGIRYIGIEKNKRNFDISCERVCRAHLQLKLAL